MTHDKLTPAEQRALARERMQNRISVGMKEILEEEITDHLYRRNSCDGYRERTPGRRGERNGRYRRDLITEVGRIEHLKVHRDREGTFLTEVFEHYHRMSGSVEEAVLEMYLQGISTRELLAAEIAPGERTEAWKDLIKGLLECKLRGVPLVTSDDTEAIKTAVAAELPQVRWQRFVVHFERNVLAKVPQKDAAEVAAD